MAKLESRDYKTGDEYGIVSLYNKITGCRRTVEQHRWEWLDTPQGIGSIWVITEFGSGEIVGHHGLIPIQMDYFGKTLLLGKTENTILHPKYLGTGIYFIYEKRFLEEAMERFDLLYTTYAHGTPGKIRRKLGYDAVSKNANYVKITSRTTLEKITDSLIAKKIAKRWLKAFCKGFVLILGYFLMKYFLKRSKTDKNIVFENITEIDTLESELDEFWSHVKGSFGITVERTSAYLRWRIFDNPNVKYEFLLARKQGKIVGYVITKSNSNDFKRGIIVDLVCEHNKVMFSTILSEAVRRFDDANIDIVSFPTLDSNNFLNRCIMRNGFLPAQRLMSYMRWFLKDNSKRENSVLLVKVINSDIEPLKIYNPSCWYYTELFTEGIT
ncbi:MAG: hypothetical protein HF982_05320 [Desulfobacteraceae bacterium]|nr:hypothetical protein [Desulfobacteraceae bacterium]MBC2718998.1 hypothetical protein [Desulfobacteraceae bacterium]